MRKNEDLEAADLLYPDLATENYQIYFKSEHRWYFLSNHLSSELIVFRQADSQNDTDPGNLIGASGMTFIIVNVL